MAKSSKVEDYWRQHNVENLFKELTQILVRRMPPDPAIAIVEHLQKKFPKSFKSSTDNTGILSKTFANNLQMQSLTSPHSDIQNESINDVQIERRSSNQSQISGIPTVGSAFTDLFKQDTSSSRLAPELNIRNLVFANRLGQQVIKMRKDIHSDHDILEEEVIKPLKIRSPTTNIAMNSLSENLQDTQTYEEPSIPQIIKYKQQIRDENDRRLHREKLAELAKYQRGKEQFLQSDLSINPEEIQQQKLYDDKTLSQVVPTETKNNTKLSHKPIVRSKEEEEILNDENIFQPRVQRDRGRQRNKLPINRSYIRRRYMSDFRPTTGRNDENLICKICGNVVNGEENQPIVSSAAPTTRSLQPQPSSQSAETTSGAVDDWFESTSNVSDPRQPSPRVLDNTIPPSTGSSTFRRSLFQPINDPVEHRPPIRPVVLADDDEKKTKRLITPRVSESGVFARSPEQKIRRSSSSRSTPSPITKKHQTETVTSDQLAKTLAQPTTMTSINDRRMSGWSVREHSPDDSDEN